jgi:formate--tetrahydrofolate ligase
MKEILSDIEIAQKAKMLPINQIAEKLGISNDALEPYGHYKAKINLSQVKSKASAKGKLILVTAISPTPAGEGKTTTSVGLNDGLNFIGKKSIVALREPSMGPCFGVKGGAAGGGYVQVVPMEDINLHFTGDFHAITAATNLLAAMIDNHIYHGNSLELDSRRIQWRRVVDMNDRSLRSVISGLGGVPNGHPRESGFDITVAGEVMAILCLSEGLVDLKNRLGQIIIGQDKNKKDIKASDLQAHGAMAVILKDAIKPNIVQSLENNPALIHGGPFANIAHGCNSIIATKAALDFADYVVTEAGFGADLGAEKFINIKCRKAGIQPAAVVLVATIRALKMHGGIEKSELKKPNVEALQLGFENLKRHIENIKKFGLPLVVAINHFETDATEEIQALQHLTSNIGVQSILCEGWAKGAAGMADLANHVVSLCEEPSKLNFLYEDQLPLREKIEKIAKEIYRAGSIDWESGVLAKLKKYTEKGYGHLPICMAKTQYSFSHDPKKLGAPIDFEFPIQDVRLYAGAGFVVAYAGEIMTMPGLPKEPAAHFIDVNEDGIISGLF